MNGHTPATEMVHPKLKTQQLFITRDDADAFHQRFYTPRSMAQTHFKSWQPMTATLRAAGVEVFSPDGKDYGSLHGVHGKAPFCAFLCPIYIERQMATPGGFEPPT